MAGQQESSAGQAPSADTLKDRIDKMDDEQELGAGSQEPDPVTSEAPPAERREGDKARDQE